MYDMAHPPSDSIENVTHSLCTLEFVPHRALYDWLIDNLEIFPSHQYEFARLNLSYTVMSKRKLLQLVQENYVDGWDDPRMPTLSGMRRKGYTPDAIRNLCDRVGVAKRENLIDIGLLEFFVREHLNKIALRRMVVFDPIKIVLTNYPENATVEMLAWRRQSRRSKYHFQGNTLRQGTLYRKRRLHGKSSKEIFPTLPRWYGAVETRLHH